MSFREKFFYLLRKYPLCRAVLTFFIAAALLFLVLVVSVSSNKLPEVTAINPQIANPGDVLRIYGENFGAEQDSSYVEIGGLRLTTSSCIVWSDTQIEVKLPQNVHDGLVYVVTHDGRSEPLIFTNKSEIPVPVTPDPQSAVPFIYNIEEKTQSVGGEITINGKNFGLMRNASRVYFSWRDDSNAMAVEYLPCSETDYSYWTDEIVRVRVPDGASSGSVHIETEKGVSNNYPFSVHSVIGTKSFSEKRTYITDISVEINDIQTEDDDASIILRIPIPPVTPSQRHIEVSESLPEPSISNMSGTMVHQFDMASCTDGVFTAKNTFVITSYAVSSSITEKQVKPFSASCLQFYASYLRSDSIVPSDNAEIQKLAKQITARTKNPYTQANLLYNHMVSSFTVLKDVRSGDASPLDLLKNGRGDTYDFAVVYCALLRAVSIPAVPVSGVLVSKSMQSQPHWWCEFYIENFGWVPADPSLGAELPYESFKPVASPKSFYFGNLDAQHLVFSRGLNQLRPTVANSKIVYRPKTYALQTIWEESSEKISRYSSYWINPNITGIY